MTQQQTEALPEGMVPWAGGDTAPADWDGGPVLIRRQHIVLGMAGQPPSRWMHLGSRDDIIAYTPKRATPSPAPSDTLGWQSIETLEGREYVLGWSERDDGCREREYFMGRKYDMRTNALINEWTGRWRVVSHWQHLPRPPALNAGCPSSTDTLARRRAALINRIGTIADLAASKPLEGELGDIAYDLLRQAAAQMSSDHKALGGSHD